MNKLQLIFCFTLMVFSVNGNAQGGRFTYSGEPFNDPEWGKSYKTSEDDRRVLSTAHALIREAVNRLEKEPGDYNVSVAADMSHVFDAEKSANPKCPNCFFSISPHTGSHLNYIYDLRLELVEGSKTYMQKAERDDNLNTILMAEMESKRAGSNDGQVQADMAAYQREVEKMTASGKIDEAKLEELQRKANAVNIKADTNANEQSLDKDFQRILMMSAYANVIKLRIITNEPVMTSEQILYASMKNNADYYYKELHLPGLSFAVIYFDKHHKSASFPFSENYTLVAYAGESYKNMAKLPKPWVKPFCIKLTANGNLEQLNELIGKIDFTKLAEVIR